VIVDVVVVEVFGGGLCERIDSAAVQASRTALLAQLRSHGLGALLRPVPTAPLLL